MPKIKDLGIKVIPDTIKPPEIGGGGGCTDCTVQQFSICGGTHCGNVTHGCSDCTVQQFSICGGTHCGKITHGCSDCTIQQFSICGGTHGCSDCTIQQFSICGGTHCGSVTNCTFVTRGCGNTVLPCGPVSQGCGAISPICAGSIIDTTIFQRGGGLTREQITSLRTSLQKELDALAEHEKSIGPKTEAEIDAREKELNDELAQLKARRKDLKK